MPKPSRYVVIVQPSEHQAALLRAVLSSHGLLVNTVLPESDLRAALVRLTALHGESPLLLVDLARLALAGITLPAFASWKRTTLPAATLVLTCSGRSLVTQAERSWAKTHGAVDLLPGGAAQRWEATLLPALRVIAAALGVDGIDPARLELFLRVLRKDAESGVHGRIAMLERLGVNLGKLAQDMAGAAGVEVKDRSYRMSTYPECFIGSEAVDWLATRRGLTRELAVLAGEALLESGQVYHVVREQPFQDGFFFYRMAARTPAVEAMDLDELVARWRGPGGVPIADRSYRGKTYALCCVGAQAVEWLRSDYALTLNEALTLGQRMVDLNILHHVTDDHGFREGNFFYRFYQDEPARVPA